MRSLFIPLFSVLVLLSCNSKNKKSGSKEPGKKSGSSEYTISKDGIGELKIGMTQAELEKLLNQKLAMKHAADMEAWGDTVMVKYKEIEVSLYFERQYNEDEDVKIMQLSAIETSSPLCKDANGIGIGDERTAVLSAFEDNPINMGPEYEQVNDSTWAPSKTKYSINVKDDKWDRELIFHLVNKKVASLQASIIMGE